MTNLTDSNVTQILVTFAIYTGVIFLLGFLASRATKNLSDFVLGGRKLSGPIAALGAGASDMSSWLLMALPGAAFLKGFNQMWLPIGLAIGAFCNWQFIAKRLRVYTEIVKDSLTIPAYLDNRFHDSSGLLRTFGAIVTIIFFTFYSSAGFVSGALLLNTTFGLGYETSLFIGASIIVAYTCIGGFLAVSWIDFFQGTLIFFALITVPIVTISHLGGWEQTLVQLDALNSGFLNITNDMSMVAIVSLLAWGLGYFGQPHILVRFMAIKDKTAVPVARLICMVWMIVALYGAVLTGVTGHVYMSGEIGNAETIFLVLAQSLFNPLVAGVLMAAVLSATMSAIAAQLLAASSSVVEDFYRAFLRRNAKDKELLIIGRSSVLLISLIAIYMALNPDNTILQLVGYAWSGLGGAFGPVILLSLYWPRMTRNGALAGLLVGAITALFWSKLGYPEVHFVDRHPLINWHSLRYEFSGIFKLNEIVPAFLLNTTTVIVVSLAGKPPSSDIRNEFSYMLEKIK